MAVRHEQNVKALCAAFKVLNNRTDRIISACKEDDKQLIKNEVNKLVLELEDKYAVERVCCAKATIEKPQNKKCGKKTTEPDAENEFVESL